MQRIGLTGGIASGKTVVAGRLAEHGAAVIDHDGLAREAVRPGSAGLDAVVESFGPGVLAADGELDRAALGRLVFADTAARERLDALVHPVIRRLAAEREAAIAASGTGAVVVHDIPLLVETGQAEAFHLLVVVQAPADLRVQRLVQTRGLTREEAERRVAAQASEGDRLAVADRVLDGSGSVEALREQVDALWARIEEERLAEVDAGL
ncbi:dephospho-CoA kinase [uncultured Cellulomonas sp.]|uniref:dephospho-CoA kinase n=1 Tax=uncultured Cellulomonas sp. TaxID=189682 RepID=UPI0026167BE4|nr:dephospho-CoA kinase [uncultured Cellulomonas sp.]